VCNEIHSKEAEIDDKFEETQKTLSLILTKLISSNAIQLDGFAVPSTRVTIPPNSVTIHNHIFSQHINTFKDGHAHIFKEK